MNHLAGTEGVVKVGANAVAELRSWSINTQADTVEDTVIGDAWKTFKPSLKSFSGNLSCFWDESDTNGQVAMAIGSEVTLNLYPEGASSTDSFMTGSVIITGIDIKGETGGMVEAAISFQGNGPLSNGVVA